jgi:hypothetical protein
LTPGFFSDVDGHVSGHLGHVDLRHTHDLEASLDLEPEIETDLTRKASNHSEKSISTEHI